MNERMVLDHMALASKLARIKSLSAPSCISFDELQSAAYMGLVDAASKFDPDRGCPFSSYARMRIDGEMKDYMRGSLVGARVRFMSDGEDFPALSSIAPDVDMSCLDDKEAKIVRLYYFDSKAMKEIGFSEGVSESRVSQILNSCRKKLERHLSKETR